MTVWSKYIISVLIVTCVFFAIVWTVQRNSWRNYYLKSVAKPPNPLLVENYQKIDSPTQKIALDFGAGIGNEAVFLLGRGWRVIALDGEPLAIKMLNQRKDIPNQKMLTTKVAKFEHLKWRELPQVDLVLASYSLPFCSKNEFYGVWQNLNRKLKANGYFVGEFFGDEFRGMSKKTMSNMTFLTKEQVLKILRGYSIVYFKEINEPTTFTTGHKVHAHIFEVIARKIQNNAD